MVKYGQIYMVRFNPSLSQKIGLEKNGKYEEAVRLEFNTMYTATDHHSEPERLEAFVDVENSIKQADSGRRSCSRWDQDSEDDKKNSYKR